MLQGRGRVPQQSSEDAEPALTVPGTNYGGEFLTSLKGVFTRNVPASLSSNLPV